MLILRAPLNLDCKRLARLFRYFVGQISVIAGVVVGLSEPYKVLYQQVFDTNVAFKQAILMPNRKTFLLERPFPGLVLASAPMHGADEPAHHIARRYWHELRLEQSDQIIRRRVIKVFNLTSPLIWIPIIVHANVKGAVDGQFREHPKPVGQPQVE